MKANVDFIDQQHRTAGVYQSQRQTQQSPYPITQTCDWYSLGFSC